MNWDWMKDWIFEKRAKEFEEEFEKVRDFKRARKREGRDCFFLFSCIFRIRFFELERRETERREEKRRMTRER